MRVCGLENKFPAKFPVIFPALDRNREKQGSRQAIQLIGMPGGEVSSKSRIIPPDRNSYVKFASI